jgi:hypothetical protein
VTGVGRDESVSEAFSKNVFSTFVCTSVKNGVPHPGDNAEPTSLRSDISLAAVIDCLPGICSSSVPVCAVLLHCQQPATLFGDSIPANIVHSGKLIQLQLEGVLYLFTKHQQFLPGDDRKYACLLRPALLWRWEHALSCKHLSTSLVVSCKQSSSLVLQAKEIIAYLCHVQ